MVLPEEAALYPTTAPFLGAGFFRGRAKNSTEKLL
jgi:hypothetical protein